MKNHSRIGIECDYSFDMLYKAAYGKKLPVKKKQELQRLSQEEINTLVCDWAQKAGWKTNPKIGLDSKNYLSFHP